MNIPLTFKCCFIFILLSSIGLPQSNEEYKKYLVHWETETYESYQTSADKIAGSSRYHVGIGHLITAREKISHPIPYYTEAEVNVLFKKDLEVALASVRRELVGFDRLPEQIKLVVVSLAFSVGPTGFHKFYKFREAINRNDYLEASAQLKLSLWAKQVNQIRFLQSYLTLKGN